MKARVYLRIGKTKRGYVVNAGKKPNYDALVDCTYKHNPYPTVLIALNLDIPDKEFDAARIQLEAKIKEAQPAVEIKQVPID